MSRRYRLSLKDAETIRKIYQDIETPIAILAKRYNVSESMISKILHGKTLCSEEKTLGDCRKRGIKHYLSKLTEADVRSIRELIARRISYREIAEMFGVKATTIASIAYGRSWKHVR